MKFRLGVNYWPASSAMYWWKRFDRSEVERDFARIRAAGFDSVRVFLLWEDFQPGPDSISDRALDDLATVADVAESNNLELMPTLFTGHMSGANWIPEWALDSVPIGGLPSRFRTVSGGRVVEGVPKNWYSDEGILEAQVRLAHAVAARLRDKRAIWAYDLGNENSNCVVPPSREAGVRWLDAVAAEIKSVGPSHAITIGLHMEDLEEDRNLGPAEAARVSDFLCMHGYPMYAPWAESSTDAMLLPFLGLITSWLAGAPALDVLFEEFGAPAVPNQTGSEGETHAGGVPLLGENEAARFTGRALGLLREFGFMGAMIWCHADYAAAMWSLPPLDQSSHERSFGLWRDDHCPKPALAEIKRLSGVDRRPLRDEFDWIDVAVSDYYKNPSENLRNLYRRFRQR
jgi:endo-1,4-beta-mannosidase